jgi:thiol-disulfide isomerase/thioredoxin
MAGVIVHPQRKEIPAFSFTNEKGEQLDLSKWKGRVVVLNLWATWCAPCRKEMPDLAKLQTALGGSDFEVVALSLDRKGLEASKAFLQEIDVTNLALYIEPEGKSLTALQALGLPATILIDRSGKEAGRLLGPADWASPEAQAMVKALIAEK